MAKNVAKDRGRVQALLDRVEKLHERLDKALARADRQALAELNALVLSACAELDAIGKASAAPKDIARNERAA